MHNIYIFSEPRALIPSLLLQSDINQIESKEVVRKIQLTMLP